MMAVRDDQLLVRHRGQNRIDQHRVGQLPHAMHHAVLIGDGQVRWPGVFAVLASSEDQLLRGERRVRVQHIHLLAVGPRRLEQRQPVALVLGEGLLVPVDHLVRVLVEMPQRDEPSPFAHLLATSRGACMRHGVGLRVAVERGLGLLGQDPLPAPLAQPLRRARVDVVRLRACGQKLLGLGVVRLMLAQNDAHQVVRTRLVVALLHLGGDLVVGLGDHVLHPDAAGVVAKCAERIDAGHAVSRRS